MSDSLNREMSNLVEHFRDERHYLSNQVSGQTISDKSDLKSEYRNYMLRNEEELNNMRLEIKKLQDCLSQKSEKIMVSLLLFSRNDSRQPAIAGRVILVCVGFYYNLVFSTFFLRLGWTQPRTFLGSCLSIF